MTDLEMLALLYPHLDTPATYDTACAALSQFVDMTQNGPPQGRADCTVDVETWTDARDLRNALVNAVRARHKLGDRLRFRGALK